MEPPPGMFPACPRGEAILLPTIHPRTRVLTDRDEESRIVPALASDLSPSSQAQGIAVLGNLLHSLIQTNSALN